jgi:small subunit ribosomal protein S8
MHNDTISDLVTRLRNATALKTDFVIVSCTKLNCSILELFKSKKFIRTFKFIKLQSTYFLAVLLSYNLGKSCCIIKSLRLVSKPSLQIFSSKVYRLQKFICSQSSVYFIISTSYGIMLSDTAYLLNIGGKILFKIEIVNL